MTPTKTRRITSQPHTWQGLQRGANQIIDVVRPTLGPLPRIVAISPDYSDATPDLYDNGGDIARRIIQIRGRDEDVGAMLVRDMLWRLQNQVGDGTVTAAVLFGAIYNQGVRYLAAGGNSRRLQVHLDAGLRTILECLSKQTIQLAGKSDLTALALSMSQDPELSRYLGEIFDIIDAFGRLEIRKGQSRQIERDYVEGMYWERGLISREMVADWDQVRTEYENSAIVISDLEITEPRTLFPVLELALRNKIKSLVIVAAKMSDSVVNFLLTNRKPDVFQVIAVTTPEYGKTDQAAALEDMAILTGGSPFLSATGATFDPITADDFGHARRAWANLRTFGIVGGKGDPKALRRHIHTLRGAYEHIEDPVAKENVRRRIGKLLGGSATLWVGGVTEAEVERRVEVAKRTAAAMRAAIEGGVTPGGGSALLNCRPELRRRAEEATDSDERAAYAALLKAVEAPTRAIITNAGLDAGEMMAEIRMAGADHGLNALNGQVVHMAEAGIYDPAGVVKSAVYTAISSASLAMTIDVIVHHAQPPQAKPLGPSARKKL